MAAPAAPPPPPPSPPHEGSGNADFGGAVSTPVGASEAAIRQAREVDRWRRRSLVIRFWRGFLPGAIGVVLLLLLGWIGVKTYQSWSQAPAKAGDIRMVRPQFYGRNSKNQPYTLTADEAVRDNHDPDLIALVQPRLTMQTEAPAPVTAQSDRGLLNEKTHLLRMNGSVKVNDGHGYSYLSDSALIDTLTHDAEGDSHVTGDGPMGHFEGDSYRIEQKNGHAVLTGHVHTHLLPHGDNTSPASPKAP